jgi:ribonuclease VapC
MVIDTSALVAVLFDEPEGAAFRLAIENDPVRLLSAASLLEASIVVESRVGEAGGQALDEAIQKARIRIVAVDAEQIEVARKAFRTFGKGRHPAALNFGDCFSYALAIRSGEPLLFKGEDFTRTDLERVAAL